MPPRTLKSAQPYDHQREMFRRDRALEILDELRRGGLVTLKRMARELDGWPGPLEVPRPTREASEEALGAAHLEAIDLAVAEVRRLVGGERRAAAGSTVALGDELRIGRRAIPRETVGCVLPSLPSGRRTAAIAMVAAARAAGVARVVVAAAPDGPEGISPELLCALHRAGADHVLLVGGAHAVAALHLGLVTGLPAETVVGWGDPWVVAALRVLSGHGSAGPLPAGTAMVAGDGARPEPVAADLARQAAEDPAAPTLLVTPDEALARAVLARMPAELAAFGAEGPALAAWRTLGKVVVVDDLHEAARVVDAFEPRVLVLRVDQPERVLERFRRYETALLGGSVGEGDAPDAPWAAARLAACLPLHAFVRVHTWLRM